ncbi:hypothetical protein MVES_001534 [Malassezia vespertilionis]|uniref:WW domain-containing protein n=1 Tax=Malassezia vespertilionis TaxID=2020962 RepID=A0A2N1JCP0_9BASI|nr:hypothetical protein MVES_001534 [Malassezia vespertilionis]
MEPERPKEKVPIPGADGWLRVTTTHGNVFYAQKKTKRSEWTIPDEIRDHVEAMEASMQQERHAKRARTEPVTEPVDVVKEEVIVAEPVPDPEPVVPEPAPVALPPAPDLSFEEGRALFMGMLTSLNGTPSEVNPMAPWDQELPKFVHLPAYSSLRSSRDREDVFNEWCKLRLREKREKTTRRAPAPAPTHPSDCERQLRSLFKEQIVSSRTTFDDAKKQFGTDPRFTAVQNPKAVFNTWMQELVEIKRRLARNADTAFAALLTERLLEPASLLGEEGIQGEPDKDQAAQIWLKAKKTPGLVEDKRYDAVGSATRRAALFATWLRDGVRVQTAVEQAPQEVPQAKESESSEERRQRALQNRQAQVLRDQTRMRERNRAARFDLDSERRETDFRQLLLDVVSDPTLTWEDAQGLLSRDDRFRPAAMRDTLQDEQKAQFFAEHIARLQNKKRDQLARLFSKHTKDEHGRERLDTAMDTVLANIRTDEGFDAGLKRFLGEDASVHRSRTTTLEREYEAWDAWRQTCAKSEFQDMLRENAFVTFWGGLRKEKEQHTEQPSGAEPIPEDEEADEEAVSVLDMASNVDLREMESVLRRLEEENCTGVDAVYQLHDVAKSKNIIAPQ